MKPSHAEIRAYRERIQARFNPGGLSELLDRVANKEVVGEVAGVCHPSPVARKAPTTSGDRRMLIIPVEHIDLNFILVPRSDMRQMVTAK